MIAQYPPIRRPSGKARWIIRALPSRLALCDGCGVKRNRLSVYPTPEGKRCYGCLHPVQRPVALVTRSASCPSPDCGRLSGHRGDHRPTLYRSSRPVAA